MNDLRFVFRFRDLVAKTIEAHQEIIDTRQACWWGWWKRPWEDKRADIWEALKSATPSTPVAIGLFDSGHDRVYRALVIGVVPPVDGELTPLAKTERNLVPAYYRDSPFSRAWMKLKSIEPMADFFGNYSFAKAPDLPNYRPETLNRFVDKKIVDPSELRGMDTTIWEVRPAKPSDPDDKIILSTQALTAAVAPDVVRCRSNRILHITDPHFGVDKSRGQHVWRLESEVGKTPANTLTMALTAAIGPTKIGAVIVTGDLTFMGGPDEFTEARHSLNRLLGLLDLNTDHLIVIPGNHDIQWSTNASYSDDAAVMAAPREAKQNYIDFYNKLFRHPPSDHLAMGRRLLLPSGLTLEIGGLNSSSLATGKQFLAGMGKIDEAAFEEVQQGLEWHESTTAALRILAIHHHLAVTEDVEPAGGYPQGYGMAVDAVRIQRLAAKNRVQLAIHGHKHRAFLWRSSVYELPEHASPDYKLGEISIIGGGSAGSVETESDSNYFNLLDFSPAAMTVEMFRSKAKGRFDHMKTFRAPFGRFDDGGLRLLDWEFVA